ncbi:MAG: HEAT repeat domain-containing protein, partial [Planctomycetaceae bacterium]|nr:HEAT repeat domain-containing protein [Planctomycetaceae bacterium]
VAISGTTRYRSGLLNKEWKDNFFATFFNSGKIVRLQIEQKGSTYRAVQREFLSSESRDFHPTDVLEDVDGSLLVVDTGGWFYRGCPTSQIAKPDIYGAIYRVVKKDLKTLQDPTGSKIDWANLSEEQLIDLFNDDRHLVREHALSESELRGSEMISALNEALKNNSQQIRLNSVWALTRIIGKLIALEQTPVAQGKPRLTYKRPVSQAHAAIGIALKDHSATVRQAACHCLMNYPDQKSQAQLLTILKGDEPSVRRVCAAALGRMKSPETIPAILSALAKDVDREEEHALIYALIEIQAPETIELGLKVNSANVQRASLIAISQLDKDRLTPELVASLLEKPDDKLGEAVMRLFKEHTKQSEWAWQAARLMKSWAENGELLRRKNIVQKLIVHFGGTEGVAEQIGLALQQVSKNPELRELLLTAMAQSNGLTLHSTWVPALEQELNSGDPARIDQVLLSIAAIKTDHFNQQLQAIGANEKYSPLLRVRALSSIGGKSTQLNDEAFSLLIHLLNNSHQGSETNIAAQLIGSSALTKKQLLALAPVIAEAGPTILLELLRPFQKIQRS